MLNAPFWKTLYYATVFYEGAFTDGGTSASGDTKDAPIADSTLKLFPATTPQISARV